MRCLVAACSDSAFCTTEQNETKMSSGPLIRTGDSHLDESGLPTVVAFLWPWLDGTALSSATWRLVGLPDDEMDDEAPSLAQLILAHAQQADDREACGDDVVELLVESIDSAKTQQILSALEAEDAADDLFIDAAPGTRLPTSAQRRFLVAAIIHKVNNPALARGSRVAVVVAAQHDGVSNRGAQRAKDEQRAPPHREPHRGKRQHGAHGNDGAVEQHRT